jgi:glycosyltransferase involved in cell wall biosynthesis
MQNNPKVSIIIRAKDEEKWISSCLSSVFRQEFTDFEVIIVDNCSVDRTLEKAKNFPIKEIVTTEKFLPGKALNLGIRKSTGNYIVCLSAHCIPINEKWLGHLLDNFRDDRIAGVYGRQEPMAFTNDVDKRDLINIFGLDRKVQTKDPFFHNANSMIKREIWEKIPFSETTTNIEDRLWAKEVLEQGYQIIYEPQASVYHYHGINQGRNVERAKNVVRILEEIHPCANNKYVPEGINIAAIVPVRGRVKRLEKISLLELAIESVKASKYVSQVIVAADNEKHLKIAEASGVRPVLRPPELSYDYVEANKVHQYVLNLLHEEGNLPDIVVLIQEVYPFRPVQLVDNMIERLVNSDRDTIIAAKPIYKSLWRENENNLMRIGNGFMPTKYKEPILMALYGLGCVMEPEIIFRGDKLGPNAGLMVVSDPYGHITASTDEELKIVEALYPKWNEYKMKFGECHES